MSAPRCKACVCWRRLDRWVGYCQRTKHNRRNITSAEGLACQHYALCPSIKRTTRRTTNP
jgi:hypothetical protein